MRIQQSAIEPVFNLVSEDGKDVKIVMGNNVISEKTFNSEAEADEYIQNKPYELIFNACILFAQWTMKESHVTKKSNDKKGNAAG